MKIAFCCTDIRPEPWLAGLRAALPDAEVVLWPSGAASEPADYAIVWAPPQAFIDLQKGEQILSCPNCLRIIFWERHFSGND
jgi:glyoxylate/hydroxypyruvate reductase A